MEKPCLWIPTSPESAASLYTKTPVMGVLDVWPALPLVIEAGILSSTKSDDIMTAFKCSDRVCKFDLRFVYVEK